MRNAKLKVSALAGAFALAAPGAAWAQDPGADAAALADQGRGALEQLQQGDAGAALDELLDEGAALLDDAGQALDGGGGDPVPAEDTPAAGDGLSTGDDELGVPEEAPIPTPPEGTGALGDTDVDAGASEANVFDDLWTEVEQTFDGLLQDLDGSR